VDACQRLRNHIVTLYADDFARREQLRLDAREQKQLYRDWSDALRQRGSLRRFSASCEAGLTPRMFDCGMASRTPGGLSACMRLSAVEREERNRQD
jgi:hypothetical protein